MQDFLDDIAQQIIERYEKNIQHLTVVFPNRRAGIFFKDALAKKITKPCLPPQILTFEDFLIQLSTKKCADKLTLVHTLFDSFIHVTGFNESFERFYQWGETLLHDFEEIDQWEVDAEDLFTNIHDLKELESRFEYLTKEQQEAISRFWKSFSPQELQQEEVENAKGKFIGLWSKLARVYQDFHERLSAQGYTYPGWVAREVAFKAREHRLEVPDHARIIFVGLNAFTRTEETVVSWFVKEKAAEIFWDIDAFYVEDKQQEAGTFFRRYQQHPVLRKTFVPKLPTHFTQGETKKVHLIGTTLEVGQAKKTGELLHELSGQKNFVPEKTVIVLPDEQLLFPVLHSIPPEISKVNVTMGYPLKKTSLYGFLEELFALQLDKKHDEEQKLFYFYHKSVLSVLKHPYVMQIQPGLSLENVRRLTEENRVYVKASDIQGEHPLYPLIFYPVEDMFAMFDYLQTILLRISDSYQEEETNHETEDTVQNEGNLEKTEEEGLQLEQELVYHLYIALNRLRSLVEEREWSLSMTVFARLFKQVMESARVPFSGEPLRGLQIMGVLETRNLDFDHVFFLSMNEGVFPAASGQSSFIPGNLRKGFGLPNQDHQDSLYAYAFFRLLQRTKNLYCFYNTEDTSKLSGDPSRFLHQLVYESERLENGSLQFPRKQGKIQVDQHILAIPVHTSPVPKITIEKSEKVRQSMSRYVKTGKKHPVQFTPSALNTYLDCRLKFYFRYVARIKEADALQEEIDPAIFGNILHRTMELVYNRCMEDKASATVDHQMLSNLPKQLMEESMQQAFGEHFQTDEGQAYVYEGKTLIVKEIISKMAQRILALDTEYAPFEILGLEKKNYFYQLEVDDAQGNPFTVSLQGIVDRIDKKGPVVRVLDYKTGRDDKDIEDMASLFDRDHPRRNKAAMQAFFYALLFEENERVVSRKNHEQVVPGLINAKNIFQEPFDPRFTWQKRTVDHFGDFREDFVKHLGGLIREIFDKEIPFDQTTDQRKCGYCPYASICF